jgi:hypothetical protein
MSDFWTVSLTYGTLLASHDFITTQSGTRERVVSVYSRSRLLASVSNVRCKATYSILGRMRVWGWPRSQPSLRRAAETDPHLGNVPDA